MEHVISSHSVYLWFGESIKIAEHYGETVTLVLWKLQIITRKIKGKLSILVNHQQYVQCLIQLKSQCQVSLDCPVLKMLVMIKNLVTAMMQILKLNRNQFARDSISRSWLILQGIWNYQKKLQKSGNQNWMRKTCLKKERRYHTFDPEKVHFAILSKWQ